MVRCKMCPQCRRMRQKCQPSDRIWIEGGLQVKCDRCSRYDHPCGPPAYPPQPRERKGVDDEQLQRDKLVTRLAIPETMCDPMAGILYPPETAARLKDVKFELRRRLTKVDLRANAARKLQIAVEFLERDQRQHEQHYAQLLELKYANTREILLLMAPAESLADRVVEAGDIEAGEIAYTRLLNAYRVLETKQLHEVRGLLLKMAHFFWKIGEPLRAEQFCWEALELREFPLRAQECDVEVLKYLARSLRQTSKDLCDVFQSSVIESVPTCFSSPLPPLQRMMESEYASTVEGNVFQTGVFLDDSCISPARSPILGGMDAILQVLREFSHSDLEMRDLHFRSPLYLAAALQKEALGHALMTRASEIGGMAERLTNTRDISGQTVLGISIVNGCSLSFVEALIDNGAEVDPGALSPLPLTPLQAAALLGRTDVVDLLLERGAGADRVYPGNPIPEKLARVRGHDKIAERLRAPLCVAFDPPAATTIQLCSLLRRARDLRELPLSDSQHSLNSCADQCMLNQDPLVMVLE